MQSMSAEKGVLRRACVCGDVPALQGAMARRVLVSVVMLSVAFRAAQGAGDNTATLRHAVARVQTDVDPFSPGPALATELKTRPRPHQAGLSAYEAEIARRFRVGSTGTGFFVNASGDLVTNAHVVLSGVRYRSLSFTNTQWDSLTRLLLATRDVWVTVGEGREAKQYLSRPIALAEDLDLAVLRLVQPPADDSRFSFLTISPSDHLKVSQPVVALGYPQTEFQVSAGEILSLIHGSQVHEEMRLVRRGAPRPGEPSVTVSGTSQGPVVRLQHSAPTGHGSSGGPLLNSRNQVIGVCYALLADRSEDEEAASNAGLNLAIASNVLTRFLREHGIAFSEAAR